MRMAAWTEQMQPSFIREILKVTQQPGVISFAGGLPAPELFPVEEIARITAQVLAESGPRVLQYSPTEGDPYLRQVLSEQLARRGTPAPVEQILLTNGSQQGLDLVAKALLDPGDAVLVENPTYLGALTAFQPYRPRVVPVACDEEGMIPEALAAALQQEQPKLIYVMPTFQNPRGTSMGAERRRVLARLCAEADVTVVEDDPYGDLRFAGTPLPGLRHYWEGAVYLGTQSKTMAPSLRLGWVVAPEALMPALKIGLQATCLNISALVQQVVARFMASPAYEQQLERIRRVYGERRALVEQQLERHFPAGTRWSRPEGGLFLWVELPEGLTAMNLLEEAIKEGALFVPGIPFYPSGGGERHMRLNFSYPSNEQILTGLERLGKAAGRLLSTK